MWHTPQLCAAEGFYEPQDTEVLPLLRDKQIWTFGADSADIDWEAAWRRRLSQLPDYHRGNS